MTARVVLDDPAGAPPQPPCPGHAEGWPRARCPECLQPFRASQRRQLFCCPEHKRAYNNRWIGRGGSGIVLYAAARASRGGTRGTDAQRAIGRQARAKLDQAVQLWREEDEAAGRMPVLEYLALRDRRGMIEVVR